MAIDLFWIWDVCDIFI